jgi:DNA-binding NarL/FixJ family response regulator
VIQDPLPLVRRGFQQLLAEHGERLALSGLTAEPGGLVVLCGFVQPDVAVFELQPDAEELVAACRAARPGVRLVALHLGRTSDHVDQAAALEVELLSYAAPPEIVVARLLGEHLAVVTSLDAERRRAKRTLTPHEREVLRLAADGLSCGETAVRLGTSEAAVRAMADRALDLLGTDTLPAAVRRAREAGLVPRRHAG